MSGTSLDGIDGVIAEISLNAGTGLNVQTLAFAGQPFSAPLKRHLQTLQQPCENELHLASVCAVQLADAYGEVVKKLLDIANLTSASIQAIGAHGQTVRHQPELGYTLQLLDGARLAEVTGIDVVCDFRSADIAAGGQGAPLAPGFHKEVFASASAGRNIVNIGGIANVTLLLPELAAPVGFDTGPGNTLMDVWCQQHLGLDFDEDGDWASQGKCIASLLAQLMACPYFAMPGPKSTGRDLFNAGWLQTQLDAHKAAHPSNDPIDVDVQATLLELTAVTIAEQLSAGDAYVCGGGAKNIALMQRLQALHQNGKILTTKVLGIEPQAVEALAFAWLGYKRVALEPANLPSVTAAKGPRILGALHKAVPREIKLGAEGRSTTTG
jgi:anhydro-N-acetylmuramic acid kinase